MNTTSMHEMLSVTTLDELLACNGQQFVRSAFQTILGREPDPEGLAYYIARLRAGYSKMRTVQQLRLSKEGFANEVRLPGLDAAVNRYKRGQYIAVGWLFRLLDGTESNHPTQRKLRGMENQLWLLSHATALGFNQMENALVTLNQSVLSSQQSAAPMQEESSDITLLQEKVDSVSITLSDELKQLSPRGRIIYLQFKTAATIHKGRTA